MTPNHDPAGSKIVVVGTGYVGLPAALMWAKAGAQVVGVDIDENVVRAINERTMLINEAELDELMRDPVVHENLIASSSPAEGDVFVIAVPTPVDPLRKVANLTHVDHAIRAIAPFLKKGNLVIVESTIPPMTCRDMVKPLIEELTGLDVPREVHLAHCPERILPGDIFQEIVHNDRLIGGMDDESTHLAVEAYSMFVKGALHRTNDVAAELSKLMENAYRDVNIAIANEFAAICTNLEADPDEVIGLANKHPRVNILQPGIGVGGHCIPVDPWFLKEVAPYDSRLLGMARMVNDDMPARVAARIRSAVRATPAPRIVLLGASYKKNCEDKREAPALQIAELLRRDGYDIVHADPLVEGMGYTSIADVADRAHLIAVLVAHDEIVQELSKTWDDVAARMATSQLIHLDK